MTTKVKHAAALVRRQEYFLLGSRLCGRWLPRGLVSLRKSNVMRREATAGDGGAVTEPTGVEVASLVDLPLIVACSDETVASLASDLFRLFFALGHTCYVAKAASGIVGYCWTFRDEYTLDFDSYHETRITVPLAPDASFIGNVFVHPSFRRRGVYSQLLCAATRDLVLQRAFGCKG